MNLVESISLSNSEFGLFQQLLREESGLHFEHERQGLLSHGLAERMIARGTDSVIEYFHLLQDPVDGAAEIKALLDNITIGETYFFRNQPQFDVLRNQLIPNLAQRRLDQRRISVWSAACSTGEEPYSIAMMLLETLPEPETWDITVLATDVNREHLRLAKRAVYGSRAIRQVPIDWLTRYFEPRDQKFHLRENVRNLVRFEYHNLVKDPCSCPGMENVDFIFCRNVTIYFSLDTTRHVMNRLANCLAPDGWLFIGDAETLWQISDRFSPVSFPDTYLYQLARTPSESPRQPSPSPSAPKSPSKQPARAAVRPPLPRQITPPAPRSIVPPVASSQVTPVDLEQALAAMQRKDYQVGLQHLNQLLEANPNHVPARLARATIYTNQETPDLARKDLEHVIGLDNLCSEAYFRLGELDMRSRNLEKAISHFQRAVYGNPNLALAYYSLGTIFQTQKLGARAHREFQNTLHALENMEPAALVLMSEDITCGQLRAACQRWLTEVPA